MDKIEVIVMGVKKVEFESKGGEKIKGTKVFFTDIDKAEDHDSVKGYLPSDHWYPGFQKFEQFTTNELPGRYEMSYEVRLELGKPKIVIKDFTYLETIDLIS